ncbi:MAG: HAD family hydrolase [Eubacteriales bacterium]|nr:HAD family hydrolase [Eubacteriales bacterium]
MTNYKLQNREKIMDVKCIALDLDGTTLKDDKTISDRTKYVIERAAEYGVHIVIATGRCFDSLPDCIRQIKGIEYAVTLNGAAIYNMREKICIRKFSISENAVNKIVDYAQSVPCAIEVFYDGKAYADKEYINAPCVYGIPENMAGYIKSTRNGVENIAAFALNHKNELDCIDILLKEKEKTDDLYSFLEEIKSEIYVTTSVDNRIEISSWEAGKHTGLQYVLELLGADKSQAAAFGDENNDVEMLKFVKYGMAVENASKKCLDAAWKIVPSNIHDGVALGIEELIN